MIRRTRTERLAIRMRLVDGELHYRRLMWRTDYIADADIAIAQLQAGAVIWLLQNAQLCTRVQRALREEAQA